MLTIAVVFIKKPLTIKNTVNLQKSHGTVMSLKLTTFCHLIHPMIEIGLRHFRMSYSLISRVTPTKTHSFQKSLPKVPLVDTRGKD